MEEKRNDGTIKEMMEAEMNEHLGYEKSQRSDSNDYRNGYKTKRINSSYGSMDIQVPQDRNSTFEPQIVKKRQKGISDIDHKIIYQLMKQQRNGPLLFETVAQSKNIYIYKFLFTI